MRARFVLPILILIVLSSRPVQSVSPAEENPLELRPDMIAFLDENFPWTLSPQQRLQRLANLLFNDNVLGFKYESETRTAKETFESRRGNCLSFTNMFIAMARHLGLSAKFREVEILPIWNQRGQVFTVSQHINVAVDIGARWFVVDLNPEVGEMEVAGRVVSDQRGLAHFYNNRAVEELSVGQVHKAESYLQRALELESKAAFLWTNLGVVRSRRDDLPGAEKAYLQALRNSRDHLPTISNLATLYTQLGKEELARHYESKAARFRNRNPYYHYYLGQKAWASEDLPQALRHYRKAVKLKKEEHRFHFALTQVYNRMGKTKQALEHLEAAVRYAPDESGRLRYHQKQELLAERRP